MASRGNFKILIVDDEIEYQDVYEMILSDKGYYVRCVSSGSQAISLLKKESFHLVLTDLIMPEMGGMELLEKIKKNYVDTKVIIVTGYGTIETAVSAIKKGAFSYFIKSHESEELLIEIKKIEKLRELEQDNKYLRGQQNNKRYLLKTNNKNYENMLKLIDKAAVSNASILITGESGVGKEIIAKHIHQSSHRNNNHFVAVNCQALSENLLESELFGHEKGAFTGALEKRIGRFEEADEGTLFLDEIGEIPVNIQVKLLRTLDTKAIERIGSNKVINVDLRLISATNRNIYKTIENGDFREDLFYRINTIIIEVPPLRERKEDISMFIDFFFERYSKEQNKKINSIEQEVMNFLLSYNYPGNIRELKNIIERLVVLSEEGKIIKADLPENKLGNTTNLTDTNMIIPLKSYRREIEIEYISRVLIQCEGNLTDAAKMLNISRRHLFSKVTEYKLKT
ncbi:sigma-54-dependent transcriptional regulator [Clostridium sp.]|uniref:sigma-54-dependent transcriptional regulator n=1 Tax=Clostridium sp. TaxID=1506 RepID=UPI003EEAB0AA